MNKAVYIGAGLDIIPIIVTDIKEFIYIDSQPFSEYGTLIYNDKTNMSCNVEKKDRVENSFSRKEFLQNLHKVMSQIHFKLIESNNTYLLFKNNEKSLKYYYSCAFPEYIDNDQIIIDINTCDTIIMAGHNPHKKIFDYLQTPVNFIGNLHTVYLSNNKDDKDENDNEYSFKYIIDNPHIIKKYIVMKCINEYEYWNNDTQIPELTSNYELIEFNKLEDIKFI